MGYLINKIVLTVRIHCIYSLQLIKMKKLLTVLAVSVFAACGSGSSSATTDSTTVVKTDSVTTIVTDSSKTTVDSTKKLIDSTKK
jgi:predicted lipoprotein